MGSEWKRYTIDQLKADTKAAIAIGPFGSRMKSDTYVATGVPVIRGNNIADTKGFVDDYVFITPEFADELRSQNVTENDLVFPHRGNIGTVGIVGNAHPRYVLSTSLMKLTCNRSMVEPLFLFYFFRSPVGHHELMQRASTVGTPGIGTPLTSLRSIPVDLPSLPEQRAIAAVLGSLDDKIEANRRLNRTLEAMARTVFRSWFSGLLENTPTVVVQQLEREGILQISDGYRAKRNEMGAPGLPFIRAGDLNDGFLVKGAEILSERSFPRVGEKICQAGDVVFTSKGTVGRFARVDHYTPRFVYSPQLCYWRVKQPAKIHPAVLYLWMLSPFFLSQVESVKGQTDMADYVSLQDQRRMRVHLPTAEKQMEIANTLEQLLDKRSANEVESRTLAELRDGLLPKLISGELRVPPAERLVGRAI